MRKILVLFIIMILFIIGCSKEKQSLSKINNEIKDMIEIDPVRGICNLKSKPSFSEESKNLIYVFSGTKYDVISTKPSYIQVIVVDKQSKKEMAGWLYIGTVNDKMTEVIGKGATLRKSAKKSSDNVIGFVWPGSKIKTITDKNVAWYKIKAKGYEGWVSKRYIKK